MLRRARLSAQEAATKTAGIGNARAELARVSDNSGASRGSNGTRLQRAAQAQAPKNRTQQQRNGGCRSSGSPNRPQSSLASQADNDGDNDDERPDPALLRMPITDVTLLCSSNNPIDDCRTPNGYERVPEDLNFGTGGRFIYLCFKRGTSAPVSEMEVLVSTTVDTDDTAAKKKPGFEVLPVNLNEGADGGHFVRLAVKKGGPPIDDIMVLTSSSIHEDDAAANKPTLHLLLEGNLNHGTTTGRFIHLAVSKVLRGVYTWGRNQSHQLGHSGTAPEFSPRVVQAMYPVQEIRMVSCGAEHSLVLATDGRVFAWGAGRNGRLGNGACKSHPLPTQVAAFDNLMPHSQVVKLSAGQAHSAALTADGRAYTWGSGQHGRLGVGKLYDHYIPTLVHHFDEHLLAPQVHVLQVACGDKHTLFLVKEKETGDESVASCGSNELGQLGLPHIYDDQSIPKMVLVFDAHKVHKLHTSHSGCGVLSDKGFFVFGCNRFGSMGQGMAAEDLPAVRKPLEIEALKGIQIVDFEFGMDHAIALSAEGQVYCWGRGDCGRLGTTVDDTETSPCAIALDGTVEDIDSRTSEERASGVGPPGTAGGSRPSTKKGRDRKQDPSLSIVSVHAGAQHTGAVAQDGTLYLWGRGTHGRLGNGDNNHGFAATPMREQVVHRVINGRKYLVGKVTNLSLGKDHSAVCVARLSKFKQLFGQKVSKYALNSQKESSSQ